MTAKERYFDILTKKRIAVRRIMFGGKDKEFAIAYEEDFDKITLITIHPLKFHQKFNRIKSRRWQRL